MKNNLMHYFTIIAYSSLYVLVSIISMIHVVSFFGMSNNMVMATSLAVAFELGCAASLVSAVSKNQMNQFIVWSLFIILTAFQMMGNTFFAYSNLHDFNSWSELFAMNELDLIEQKRYLSIISGAILPVVALGYIKCLVDYLSNKNKPVAATTEAPVAVEEPKQEEPAVEPAKTDKDIEKEFLSELNAKGIKSVEKIAEPVAEETIIDDAKVAQDPQDAPQGEDKVNEGFVRKFNKLFKSSK